MIKCASTLSKLIYTLQKVNYKYLRCVRVVLNIIQALFKLYSSKFRYKRALKQCKYTFINNFHDWLQFECWHLQSITFLSSSAEITRHVNQATFINLPASSSSRTLLSCVIFALFLRLGLVSETTSPPLKATKERRDSISLTGIRSTT